MADITLNSSSQPEQTEATPALQVSVGGLVIVGILVLVAILRLASLGAFPLGDAEAHEALASYNRLVADHPVQDDGATLFPLNSLGALVNMVLMSLMGHSDVAVRLGTALSGIALTATPLLFRRQLGGTAALMLMIGLMVSPVAVLSARTMGGVTWALLLVMIGAWLALRFAEHKRPADSIGATICGMGVLFLTTPLGFVLAMSIVGGVLWALIRTPDDAPARTMIPETATRWSGFEAVVASVVAIIVVATVFFTVPSGLSSIGQIPEAFLDGLTTRTQNVPLGFALLVSLRYDAIFWLFGIIGLVAALRDGTFLEHIFTGWFVLGTLMLGLYASPPADAALILTLPLVGLTVSLVLRLLQSTSYGFWQVPNWLLPVHGLIVAALIVGMAANVQNLTHKLHEEATIVSYAEVLDPNATNGTNVRIGTLQRNTGSASMASTLPYALLVNCTTDISQLDEANLEQAADGRFCERQTITTYTVQVVPLDDALQDALFEVRNITSGDTLFEERIGDGLLTTFEAAEEGEYRFDVVRTDGMPTNGDYQYLVALHQRDLVDASFFDTLSTRVPELYGGLQIALRNPNRVAGVVLLMLLLLLPITFFVAGAFYGSRAAWRGILLGVLAYGLAYSLSIGYVASVEYGGDVRELWFRDATPQDYHTLSDVLAEYSRRDNGTPNEIAITVEGEYGGALGWALRRFPHARFVEELDPSVTTPAVIAPQRVPPPGLGQDYVGQTLELDYDWNPASLNWSDFGAWMFNRETRFEPELSGHWRVWIARELYDVQTLPSDG